jgi:hypothetical protein
MSTLLDNPLTPPAATNAAQRLRTSTAAVRVSLGWLGVRKTLSPEQKAQAADTFGAEGSFLSAGKKLLDTKHPTFKAVTAVKSRVISYWKGCSLPFPEPGIRLIRQDRIEAFDTRMCQFRDELAEAVETLEEHYLELRQAARDRLGSLYNSADYPDSLVGLFSIDYDFPSVEPPDYLLRLNPEIYEQEYRRVQDRFNDAVRLAEEAFIGELAKIVSHLTERLSGTEDGKPKVFRDSAVNNLVEFFERFRELNVRSSQHLDQLVEDAQQIVRGVEPQSLRDNQGLRQHVATELSRVQSVLDGLLVDRPRRNILRRPK